jgi:methionyl-tRNA formyltransferase
MRVVLFAADQVGLKIARFLCAQRESPVCLVLDANDRQGLNAEIQRCSGLTSDQVILTDKSTRHRLAEQLRKFDVELSVLAWWPYILKKDVLAVPKIGCLNFHPSLLPHGRGKAPNFWSLVSETPYGVTIHWVNEGIDSGDIAFQQEIDVSWEDTGKTLHQKSRDALVELFKKHWPEICQGKIPRTAQPDETVCHFQRELDDASRIDLDALYSGREILNIIRARTFEPHPGAWFEDAGQKYEVRISISNNKEQSHDTRRIRRA